MLNVQNKESEEKVGKQKIIGEMENRRRAGLSTKISEGIRQRIRTTDKSIKLNSASAFIVWVKRGSGGTHTSDV